MTHARRFETIGEAFKACSEKAKEFDSTIIKKPSCFLCKDRKNDVLHVFFFN